MDNRTVRFLFVTVALWLLAHAIGLFSHEFSHTFVAMGLGWKSNPLDLDWGSPSIMNILMQQDIDENVDYAPIFASGHGFDAGLIALAGSGLGNMIVSLGISLALLAMARQRHRVVLGYFAYWIAVMSVGNLISYVPLRVFASHADMHTVALGFGWSPQQVLWFVGIPFFAVVIWFFAYLQPRTLAWLFPGIPARRYAVVFLTSATMSGFFCLSGLSGYGETSHRLALAFMSILGPVTLLTGILLTRRSTLVKPELG